MNYCNPLIFLPKSAEAYLVGAADCVTAVGIPAEISAKFVKIRVWEQFFAFFFIGVPHDETMCHVGIHESLVI